MKPKRMYNIAEPVCVPVEVGRRAADVCAMFERNPCNLVESRSVESDNPRRTATSHVILGCSWMERGGGQTQSERKRWPNSSGEAA